MHWHSISSQEHVLMYHCVQIWRGIPWLYVIAVSLLAVIAASVVA